MLKPSDKFLFTRQRHEAERMGLHYDYRLVHGDKAYSFATKKEMPEPGKMILLFEQPVHDRHYALSEKVVIPSGQYGAGVTYLDMIRKAHLSEDSTEDKMVIHTDDGGKFLLKRMPKNSLYGDKAWLFRNLTPEPEHSINLEKNRPMNKYLETITQTQELEKDASIVGAGIVAHLAQNLGTHFALKNKHVAKYLANSFAAGANGLANHSLKAKFTSGALGAILPDLAVAHKSVNDLGRALKPLLDGATKRQQAGLRMLSEGRLDAIKKYNLHADPVIQAAHATMKKHVPSLPSMDTILAHGKHTQQLFKDKTHPLLSNIASKMSRGNAPIGKHFTPAPLTAKPGMIGAISSFAAEPASGTINMTKNIMASKAVSNNKYGKKIKDTISKHLIRHPIEEGIKAKGTNMNTLSHKALHFGVNPVSANLKRTSAALADVHKLTL